MPLRALANPKIGLAVVQNPLIVESGTRLIDATILMANARTNYDENSQSPFDDSYKFKAKLPGDQCSQVSSAQTHSQTSLQTPTHLAERPSSIPIELDLHLMVRLLEQIHEEARASCVFIVKQGKLCGILTASDVVRLNSQDLNFKEVQIDEVMDELVAILKVSEFKNLFVALHLLNQHGLRYLPLVDDAEEPIGLLTRETLWQVASYRKLQYELKERHETEEKLRASEQRYFSLTKSVPIGIVRSNLMGKSIYANQRFCEILESSAKAIDQLGWEQSIHPDDRDWVLEEVQHYRHLQQAFSLEYRIQRRRGGTTWVLAQSLPEYNAQGKIVGYITTITDITNQKKSEAALQRLNQELETKILERTTALKSSEEQFRRLFEKEKVLSSVIRRIRQSLELENVLLNTAEEARKILLTDRVVIYKVFENGRGKIVAESRSETCSSLNNLEFSREIFPVECHQKYIAGHVCTITDRDRDEIPKCLLDLMQTLQIQAKLVVPIIEQKSNQLWGLLIAHQCHVSRYWCTGEVEFLQRLAEQCSIAIQQSELYEQLQESNLQLARATRLKDEFLANMSHELRTPLNAILGMSEVLQDQIYGQINHQQLQSLKTIERSGSHLLDLINDILDLAKIESGQISLHRSPTQINQLCHSSLVFVKQQAIKKQIRLNVLVQPDLPDLLIDERRIRQVLINLLSNAIKFTPEEGQVTLEVAQISHPPVNPSQDNPTDKTDNSQPKSHSPLIRFSVSDTGIGIAPDDISKLFQPFVQIDSSLSRQYAGTGLGLSLVKRMVEMHGGWVSVVSTVGVGSCFQVDLPWPEVVSPSAQTSSTSTVNLDLNSLDNTPHSPVILLAEDNEANINTISSYLKAKNYKILLAPDGLEAISMAQTHRPDVILMDIQMPNLDGFQAMEKIRQIPELANTIMIALTALAMPGDRERCLKAGASDYFTKPIKLKQLAARIHELLSTQPMSA